MIGPKENGGLDLPDYESIKNSLLVSWVKRIIDGSGEDWMAIPSYYLEDVRETFIFEYNYDFDLLHLNRLPEFFVDILKAWSEIKGECTPENHLQIRDEILWNNKI